MVGIIAVTAVAAVVMTVGCIAPPINEERELVKQWLQMYGVYETEVHEGDLDEFMAELKKWDIHPVEIYRGSMIFYEKSYGYIYISDWDDDFRQMPPDRTDTEYDNLVKENGGTRTAIFDTQWCVCFPNLSDAESFLAEFWSV